MKYIAYILSMPNKGSWDGKWTGDKNLHARIRKISDRYFDKSKEKDLIGKSFYHDFGDGWTAEIQVLAVDEKQAKALKKRSVGFAGYDWMLASLIYDGTITYNRNWQMPFYY